MNVRLYTSLRVAAALAMGAIAAALIGTESWAQAPYAEPVRSRNLGLTREDAARAPRSESDQALRNGWPLYRTERGQIAFNDAMAALQASDFASPPATIFKACPHLNCALSLPLVQANGWLPSGRLWTSPQDYVLIVHSPRSAGFERRRAPRSMRVFVLHEFHNSSRNTDVFDTISSHKSAVFVPLYMSKTMTDARGRRFVMIIQVSPIDVVSIHATNHGSAGPGIEVAKNAYDTLEPLQGQTGVLASLMIKAAVPHLMVVNHHGREGRDMLNQFHHHLAQAQATISRPLVLPFTRVEPARANAAMARLDQLVMRNGSSSTLAMSQRALTPPRFTLVEPPQAEPRPALR